MENHARVRSGPARHGATPRWRGVALLCRPLHARQCPSARSARKCPRTAPQCRQVWGCVTLSAFGGEEHVGHAGTGGGEHEDERDQFHLPPTIGRNLGFSLVFARAVVDWCRVSDDRECSGKPYGPCSSALELSIVQIGLETAEIRAQNETQIAACRWTLNSTPAVLLSVSGRTA